MSARRRVVTWIAVGLATVAVMWALGHGTEFLDALIASRIPK